jgi:hypothetical protein
MVLWVADRRVAASDGRGRAVMLSHLGEWVIEFGHPTRKTTDGANPDRRDASSLEPGEIEPGSQPRRDGRTVVCCPARPAGCPRSKHPSSDRTR